MAAARKGIGGHQSHAMGKDEWLTPPFVLEALGAFDLDPCAPAVRPWDMAASHYSIFDNGLTKPWHGRVWCNPPYGEGAWRWLARCADHRNATALVFARTETEGFFAQVWLKATAVLFLKGRLTFHHVDGRRAESNGGAPSVLIAYDGANAQQLHSSGLIGQYIDLRVHNRCA